MSTFFFDGTVVGMTPEDIEALFESGTHPQNTGQDEDETISDEEKVSRTRKLRNVFLAAQHAWLSGSESIDLIAEKLGDGSRDGE